VVNPLLWSGPPLDPGGAANHGLLEEGRHHTLSVSSDGPRGSLEQPYDLVPSVFPFENEDWLVVPDDQVTADIVALVLMPVVAE
jgi:hypothetical protein